MAETNIIDELKSLNQNLSLNIEKLQAENDQLKVLNQSLLLSNSKLTTKNNELEQELRQSKAVSLKIFLAASTVELVEERKALFKHIKYQNKNRKKSNQYIELYWCKKTTDQSQKEFNKAIRDCNIFLLLYHNKVGKDTVKEYEIAYTLSKFTEGWPKIRILAKQITGTIEFTGKLFTEEKKANIKLLNSLIEFEEKCNKRGDYYKSFTTNKNLILQINNVINDYFKDK